MTLVAVSKTVDAVRLRAAVAAGFTLLGENRVQEGEAKAPEVPGASWQLLGPLQSNKARRALEVFDAIQTVDSLALGGPAGPPGRGGTTRCPLPGAHPGERRCRPGQGRLRPG